MFNLVRNQSELVQAIDEILADKLAGTDTETYGKLRDDKLFSIQIAIEDKVFYFNFQPYPDELFEGKPVPVLDRAESMKKLKRLFAAEDVVYFIHNAKFDMRRFSMEGLNIHGHVHCTQMQERFVHNQRMLYSLDACLSRIGLKKDDAVAEYIKANKLWTMVDGEKVKHYDKVPFNIMFTYGCIDAEGVRKLGIIQRNKLQMHDFYHNDLKLQKVAFAMEELGIACDRDYARRAKQYELQRKKETEHRLEELAGEPFRTGPNWLQRIFDKHGVQYRKNPKTGNPVFDKHALDEIEHPIADLIRKHRRHVLLIGTYFGTYEKHDIVHATIKLAGTDTGRFSYSEPNLQNLPKEEEPDKLKEPDEWEEWNVLPFPVRGSLKPRTKDHVFVMIDFNQQEFRLLLDYAGEHELIRRINEFGEDVHQATADMVGITRKQAKTLNFALLYGMGVKKLAKSLNISGKEALAIKELYFSRLPKVAELIKQIIAKSSGHKSIMTWCKRELQRPSPYFDKETKSIITFDYKMPNHLIQGGCGDIARFAMVACSDALKDYPESNILVQVHDELLFEFHKDDLHMIEVVRKLMEDTYQPFNGMKLTCGVEHSWKSWSSKDVRDGLPTVEAA